MLAQVLNTPLLLLEDISNILFLRIFYIIRLLKSLIWNLYLFFRLGLWISKDSLNLIIMITQKFYSNKDIDWYLKNFISKSIVHVIMHANFSFIEYFLIKLFAKPDNLLKIYKQLSLTYTTSNKMCLQNNELRRKY